MSPPAPRWAVIGGAGFIGSHLVGRLLREGRAASIAVFDNFSSGSPEMLARHAEDPRLEVIEGDCADLDALVAATAGAQILVHLASNPDIARAQTEPAVDFDAGTLLTHHVAEAARRNGVERVLYASGSGIYGDLGATPATEDHGPLLPVSTYGASKLAGEALLCAYAHMFGVHAHAFRFANVVGPRQTHGVGYDFLGKLRSDPTGLEILGDGGQTKSYIHVDDVLDAVLLVAETVPDPFSAHNVATEDLISVTEIATLACRVAGLDPDRVDFRYTGGRIGWKGDVPLVVLDSTRIRARGWSNRFSSSEAMTEALRSMWSEWESKSGGAPTTGPQEGKPT